MDPIARKSEHASRAEPAIVNRVPVIGVVLAAALALGSAAVTSGYAMGGPPLFATLLAVGGGVVWLYQPRVGYWLLLAGGLVTIAVSGVALAQGAVPWLLVSFWGGSALLLAAILHLTVGSGRSSMVTVVAVISLLALSALGLGQYVRTTWTSDERAILEHLPQIVTPALAEPTWVAAVAPAPEGAWCCTWLLPAAPQQALGTVRAALLRDGWSLRVVAARRLLAEKAGESLDITVVSEPDGYPSTPTGYKAAATRVSATVHEVPAVSGQ